MKNGRMLTDMKAFAYELVDNNGNMRTVPIGQIGKRNLSEDRLKLLQDLMRLLQTTSIISDTTRMYIFNRYITIKGVNDVMNEALGNNEDNKISYNSTMARIGYDRRKLDNAFESSMFTDIILKRDNEDDIARHRNNIARAYIKYGKLKGEDIRDNLALKLDRDCLCSELDDNKFDQFISVIMPYLKSHMDKVANSIDTDCIGYFNYLVLNPMLTDKDKQRFEFIKQLLDTNTSDLEHIDIE